MRRAEFQYLHSDMRGRQESFRYQEFWENAAAVQAGWGKNERRQESFRHQEFWENAAVQAGCGKNEKAPRKFGLKSFGQKWCNAGYLGNAHCFCGCLLSSLSKLYYDVVFLVTDRRTRRV